MTIEQVLTNQDYFQALLTDIDSAKSSIDLEVYIFADDIIGNRVSTALMAAARRRVSIRILVDGAGTPDWGGEMTHQLEHASILTRVFNPLPWKIWHWGRTAAIPTPILSKIIFLLKRINTRNHRKTCIIDKEIVYVSTANIIKCHLSKQNGGEDWRDTSIRLTDVNITDLQYAFEKAWGGVSIKKRVLKVFRRLNPSPVFRLNDSFRRRIEYRKNLMTRIKNAKNRIWITNAYFIPESFLLDALIEAAARGVDVRILLPHKSDIFIINLMATTFYTALIKAKVTIYEYLPSVLHAKIIIIDDWFCVGSSNMNSRSFNHDLEIDVHISSESVKQTLLTQFHQDLNQAKQMTLDDLQKQSGFKQLIGRILLYLRYWF